MKPLGVMQNRTTDYRRTTLKYRNGQFIVTTRNIVATRHHCGQTSTGPVKKGTVMVVCDHFNRKAYVPRAGFNALEDRAKGAVLQFPGSVVTGDDEPWDGTESYDSHESSTYYALTAAALHLEERYNPATVTAMLESSGDTCHTAGLAELRHAKDAARVYAEAERIQRGFMEGEQSFIRDECQEQVK